MLTQVIPDIVFYGAFDEYITLQEGVVIQKVKTELRLPNNINCRIPGIQSEEMILRLDALGFSVSHKSACASMETEGSYVVMALGANEHEALENIRISMGRNTKMEDMKALVQAMSSLAQKYRSH
jgi:cysteine desulfurase